MNQRKQRVVKLRDNIKNKYTLAFFMTSDELDSAKKINELDIFYNLIVIRKYKNSKALLGGKTQ